MSATQAKGGASNSFFGRLVEAGTQGIEEGLTSALPRWANKSFDDQSKDQLSNPTFNAAKAPARIDQVNREFDENDQTTRQGRAESMGLSRNTMILGGAVLALVALGVVMSRR